MKKLLALLVAFSFLAPVMAAEPAKAAPAKKEQTAKKEPVKKKTAKKHKKFDGTKVPEKAPAKKKK